jgi:hypothetical protein
MPQTEINGDHALWHAEFCVGDRECEEALRLAAATDDKCSPRPTLEAQFCNAPRGELLRSCNQRKELELRLRRLATENANLRKLARAQQTKLFTKMAAIAKAQQPSIESTPMLAGRGAPHVQVSH